MLNSVLALKSFVLLNSIGLVLLVAAWFNKRFICKYLCPVGCLFDVMPKRHGQKKSIHLKSIPSIGKWLAISSLFGALFGFPLFIYADPISIFNGFFASLIHLSTLAIIASGAGFLLLLIFQLIFPGVWCKRICPLGGLQLLVSELKSLAYGKKTLTEKIDMGRRFFVGSLVGTAAALFFPFVIKAEKDGAIRPPAFLKPDDSFALCTRCGSCIKACPTKILEQDTRLGFGFLTPVVNYNTAYCLETCNACSVVCPSGAITLFNVNAKSRIIMGKAAVATTDCLLSSRTECDRCKVSCTYKAIYIQEKKGETLILPEVDLHNCVGCGACKVVCPNHCITIVKS